MPVVAVESQEGRHCLALKTVMLDEASALLARLGAPKDSFDRLRQVRIQMSAGDNNLIVIHPVPFRLHRLLPLA